MACTGEIDHSGGEAVTFSYTDDEVVSLSAEMRVTSRRLAEPHGLVLHPPYLLVSEIHNLAPGHIIDSRTGEYVRALGVTGEGPGEFTTIQFAARSLDDTDALIYDTQQRQLTPLDVSAYVEGDTMPRGEAVSLAGEGFLMDLGLIGDSLIIATGILPEGRFAHFNAEGTHRRYVGTVPGDVLDDPLSARQQAYRGRMVVEPGGTRIALALAFSDRLEIWEANGDRVAVTEGPDRFRPAYEVGGQGGGMAVTEDTREAYVDVAATQNRIYVLYSGQQTDEAFGFAGRFVHVFDWEGRFRRAYRLDTRALGIAVDPEENALWITEHDPQPAVVRYEIPRSD